MSGKALNTGKSTPYFTNKERGQNLHQSSIRQQCVILLNPLEQVPITGQLRKLIKVRKRVLLYWSWFGFPSTEPANQASNYKLNFISAANCGQGSCSSATHVVPVCASWCQGVKMCISTGQRAKCHLKYAFTASENLHQITKKKKKNPTYLFLQDGNLLCNPSLRPNSRLLWKEKQDAHPVPQLYLDLSESYTWEIKWEMCNHLPCIRACAPGTAGDTEITL